jgi:hypothetical protein
MRTKKELTEEEKDFVISNRFNMTFEQMREKLDHNSISRIYGFLNPLGKKTRDLSDEQKDFIKENYLTLTESEMARRIKTTRHYIQEYKSENGLLRATWKVRKIKNVTNGMFFDVDRRENWVA